MFKGKLKFSSELTRVGIAIIILIIGIVLYKVISVQKVTPKQKPKEETVESVACIPIKLEPVKIEINSYGTVRNGKVVSVTSEVIGKVSYTKPDLKSGSLVKMDEVLVKVEDKNYKIDLNRAQASIEALNAQVKKQELAIKNNEDILQAGQRQFDLEQKQYDRSKLLYDQSQKKDSRVSYSTAAFEAAGQSLQAARKAFLTVKGASDADEIELKALKVQFESAVVAKEEAELNLERCIIKSPINGRIENLNIEEGEYLTKSQSIFDIVDDKSLEIPVSLSSDEAGLIFDFSPGENVDYANWFNYDENDKVLVEWSDGSDKLKWSGSIISIESFDTETRTITVIVEPVENLNETAKGFPLVSGMFCKVIFTGKEIEDAVKIPLNALQLNGCIYVVGEDNKVREIKVDVIKYDSYQVVVSSDGIEPGDYLVVQSKPHGMPEGKEVKKVEPLEIVS